MEKYILWKNGNVWKVFDPDTSAQVGEFKSEREALAYINGEDPLKIQNFFLRIG
jgi:hypothetical protein